MMSINRWRNVARCVSCFLVSGVGAQQPTEQVKNEALFVLPSSPATSVASCSKNALKEKVGHAVKDVVHAATKLSLQLAALQQQQAQEHKKKAQQDSFDFYYAVGQLSHEVCSVQRMVSTAIERLLDNDRPFKKAGKVDLTKSLKNAQDTHRILQQQEAAIKKLLHDDKIAPESVTLVSSAQITACVGHVRKAHECLCNDVLLKAS